MARLYPGFVILAAVMIAGQTRAFAAGLPSDATQPSAQSAAQSAANLDALLFKRPYGLGLACGDWHGQAKIPVVGLGPLQTPAAGFVLLRAGQLLHNQQMIHDSQQIALVLAQAQGNDGKTAATLVFGNFATPRDSPITIHRRDYNFAAIGLLLAELDGQRDPDPRLRIAAIGAVTWLMRQQLDGGGCADDPDASPNPPDHVHRIRLDRRDYRDFALTMMLAGSVLDRKDAVLAADNAAAVLRKLRLGDIRDVWARHVWAAAYSVSGQPLRHLAGVPWTVDTASTRRAMQTLLLHYLLTGNADSAKALHDAADTMAALRRPDGNWFRCYGLTDSPGLPASRPASQDIIRPMANTRPSDEADSLSPASLDYLIRYSRAIGDKSLKPLDPAALRMEICATLCGLTDDPLDDLKAADADALLQAESPADTSDLDTDPQRLRDNAEAILQTYKAILQFERESKMEG